MATEPGKSANPANKRNPKNLVNIGSLITGLIKNGYVLVVLRKEIDDNEPATLKRLLTPIPSGGLFKVKYEP